MVTFLEGTTGERASGWGLEVKIHWWKFTFLLINVSYTHILTHSPGHTCKSPHHINLVNSEVKINKRNFKVAIHPTSRMLGHTENSVKKLCPFPFEFLWLPGHFQRSYSQDNCSVKMLREFQIWFLGLLLNLTLLIPELSIKMNCFSFSHRVGSWWTFHRILCPLPRNLGYTTCPVLQLSRKKREKESQRPHGTETSSQTLPVGFDCLQRKS